MVGYILKSQKWICGVTGDVFCCFQPDFCCIHFQYVIAWWKNIFQKSKRLKTHFLMPFFNSINFQYCMQEQEMQQAKIYSPPFCTHYLDDLSFPLSLLCCKSPAVPSQRSTFDAYLFGLLKVVFLYRSFDRAIISVCLLVYGTSTKYTCVWYISKVTINTQ